MPRYEVEIEHREDDQVFSYYHGSDMLHFNASLLARLRQQMPNEFRRITLDIGPGEYALVMEHRGIEAPKLEALKPADLREPGYGVFFDDGTFTVIDGHHRLVRRYCAGASQMDFWVCGPEVWRHCLVAYGEEEKQILAEHIPPRVDNPTHLVSRVTLKQDRKHDKED